MAWVNPEHIVELHSVGSKGEFWFTRVQLVNGHILRVSLLTDLLLERLGIYDD